MEGFMGSRWQVVLSTYLEALSVEQRDRVVAEPALSWRGWRGSDPSYGPCLTQAAECGQRPDVQVFDVFELCPIALQIGHRFELAPWWAFDESVAKYGEPFIQWLKAECARLNGSSPSDIARLSHEVVGVEV